MRVAPLAFGSLLGRIPEVATFQLEQTASNRLLVRLATTPASGPALVQQHVQREMRRLLASYHVEHIGVDADNRPPLQAPGGKRRTVIPYGAGTG
ncbi:hypothetical protein GCM10022204_36550 [Microlunatus aurantiacus]|uniref:Uncharacterized protein n=1 Tax=Microlunatus aurantiacus TaxID=446786 RepID=A0ABP7E6M5_9ACTN